MLYLFYILGEAGCFGFIITFLVWEERRREEEGERGERIDIEDGYGIRALLGTR
jgi:hypothetical protein